MNPVEPPRRARVRRLFGALLIGVACAGSVTPAAAQTLRWSSQGDPLTMDHNPQRLNVELGKDTRITRFWCG